MKLTGGTQYISRILFFLVPSDWIIIIHAWQLFNYFYATQRNMSSTMPLYHRNGIFDNYVVGNEKREAFHFMTKSDKHDKKSFSHILRVSIFQACHKSRWTISETNLPISCQRSTLDSKLCNYFLSKTKVFGKSSRSFNAKSQLL